MSRPIGPNEWPDHVRSGMWRDCPWPRKGLMNMRAELILDLHGVGADVGRARGRDVSVFPALGNIGQLWRHLGVDISAIHVVAPGMSSHDNHDAKTFDELHTAAWWKTEAVFLEDQTFDASLSFCALGEDGPIGLDELVTTIALSRSDELEKSSDADLVIVMSNSPEVAPAVTYARGVPVMIAGTIIADSGLSHARLDLSWMGLLKDRFASFKLNDVELRDGRPWSNGVAICTPFDRTDGRDAQVGELPSFAESVALFDPEYFHVEDNSTSPDDVGIASVVHTLGLGTLVHIEDVSTHRAKTANTTSAATLYRYAADNPDAPIVVASTRPGMIALTSALDTYQIDNPERILRLCLPDREHWFDEAGFASARPACRIVIEQTLTEPLFGEDEERTTTSDSDGPTLTLLQGGEDDSDAMRRSTSPTLVLYANPNTVRDDSEQWRQSRQRRFLLLGANGAEATPAHHGDGTFLPISLGGCTDFTLRRPPLRPGCVVEGVLSASGDRWVVVSDPIERRRASRAGTNRTKAEAGKPAAA